MFLVPVEGEEPHARPEADELPGPHAPLRLASCGATASCRSATPRLDAAPQRARRHAARPPPRPARDPGRRAHLLHRGAGRRPRSTAASSSRGYLYALFGVDAARRALDPAREQARHRRGVGLQPRASSQAALERHGIPYEVGEGEGTFYGPKIDLHMDDALGRSWQMGTIQARRADAAPLRAHLHGRRQRRAHAGRDPPRAARLARALHRHPHRALRRRASRSGSRRCRCGCSRSASATTRRRRAARAARRGLSASTSTTRDETLGKRIRDAELEKIPYVVVYGDRESDEALAVRERGGEQSTKSARRAAGGVRAAELATL